MCGLAVLGGGWSGDGGGGRSSEKWIYIYIYIYTYMHIGDGYRVNRHRACSTSLQQFATKKATGEEVITNIGNMLGDCLLCAHLCFAEIPG